MRDRRNERKYLLEYNVLKNDSHTILKKKREYYTNFRINSIVKEILA